MNAVSELVAMVVSFVVAVFFQVVDTGLEDWQQLLGGVAVTTIAWVAAAFLTKPADEQTLKRFCRKINPGGPGWKHVYEAIAAEGGTVESDSVNLPQGILCMVLGCAMVYSALFATGFWLYGQTLPATILTIAALGAAAGLFKVWGRK